MKKLEVISGVLIHPIERRILLAKRQFRKTLGGKWEFPSGKLLPGETTIEALHRKIKEEVGVIVLSQELIHHQTFRGADVYTYLIKEYYGEVDEGPSESHLCKGWFSDISRAANAVVTMTESIPSVRLATLPIFNSRREFNRSRNVYTPTGRNKVDADKL